MKNTAFQHKFSKDIYHSLHELQINGIVKDISTKIEDGRDLIFATYIVPQPQYRVVEIESNEMVVFVANKESIIPVPYFTRDDFPLIPHLLRNTGKLKSPCLFQAHQEQIALNWNALKYVTAVAKWLVKSINGTLHQEDQNLEDFVLVDHGVLILPLNPDLAQINNYSIQLINEVEGKKIFKLKEGNSNESSHCVPILFNLGRVKHSGILPSPTNLNELVSVVKNINPEFDFISILKQIFLNERNYGKDLVIFFLLNIVDNVLRREERREYGFYCPHKIEELAVRTNLVDQAPGSQEYLPLIHSKISVDKLIDFGVISLSVSSMFTNRVAKQCNDNVEINYDEYCMKITQIGAGAIGSQIARNLTQSGYASNITFYDDDVLLPHNLSRWITSDGIGNPKSEVLSNQLNSLINNDYFSKGNVEKIQFGNISDEFYNTAQSSDHILDSSASIVVQRTLDLTLGNRGSRVTTYITPSGKGLVIMSTKANSAFTHTWLEMLSYEEIVSNNHLQTLLGANVNGFTYSGDSCRSISFRISTHHISMWSAIASKCIEEYDNQDYCRIYQINEDSSIHCTMLDLFTFEQYEIEGQRTFISKKLKEDLIQLRKDNLPNETGGVLIGSFNHIDDSLYIISFIPAPVDSESSNQSFLRGNRGLGEKIALIEKQTHSNLQYIGEWHSHPNGYSSKKSQQDEKQYSWLNDKSKLLSHPLVMMIVGENEESIYITKNNQTSLIE